MPKHNYSQYSNAKKYDNKPKTEESVEPMPVEPAVEVKMVVEDVEAVILPKIVEGTVSNCAKLNVREKPSFDADIVCVLDVNSEMKVDVDTATDEWVYANTAVGIEGYCMRKFVNTKL